MSQPASTVHGAEWSGAEPSGGSLEHGWYLYAVTRRTDPVGETPRVRSSLPGTAPVEYVEVGPVRAFVQRVPVQELDREHLESLLGQPGELEELVRSHNAVVAAAHQEGPVLPAKFGSVYARLEDLRTVLEADGDALASRLEALAGADEWALHVYADAESLERYAATYDPEFRQVRADLESAGAGRAYFLQRKLEAGLAAARQRAQGELALSVHDRLAPLSQEAQVSPRVGGVGATAGESEILRGAYLVHRTQVDSFLLEVEELSKRYEGLRGEYTGPWPPYSFASMEGATLSE
ncbi:MAG: GvpL/GvpF family gas vesicle protein [Chloroflexota bacterium]|nr:GvpL/GvpF family gas vesicle protein [Chloroflexota bacterium]